MISNLVVSGKTQGTQSQKKHDIAPPNSAVDSEAQTLAAEIMGADDAELWLPNAQYVVLWGRTGPVAA